MAIKYRIAQIRTPQFAIFPDNYDKQKDVNIHVGVSFNVTNPLHLIKCIFHVDYSQGERPLMKTVVECVFEIAKEAAEEIKKTGKIKVEFLRYVGTITVGTARGVIAAKTENTEINHLVLPPVNLVEHLKEDLVLEE